MQASAHPFEPTTTSFFIASCNVRASAVAVQTTPTETSRAVLPTQLNFVVSNTALVSPNNGRTTKLRWMTPSAIRNRTMKPLISQ